MTKLVGRPSAFATVLTWLALGILALAVLLAEVAVFPIAQSMAKQYPEFAQLRTPLLLAAIAFGVCVEVVLAVVAILVGFIRNGRILGQQAPRLVDVLMSVIAVATVIVLTVLLAIPGPPFLAFVLVTGVLVGATFVLVLLVLRSLLRRAVSMRAELDEVV
jgi:Protein of unknown function (DUF2975)